MHHYVQIKWKNFLQTNGLAKSIQLRKNFTIQKEKWSNDSYYKGQEKENTNKGQDCDSTEQPTGWRVDGSRW